MLSKFSIKAYNKVSEGNASVSYQMINEESRNYSNRAYAVNSTAVSFYALIRSNFDIELELHEVETLAVI